MISLRKVVTGFLLVSTVTAQPPGEKAPLQLEEIVALAKLNLTEEEISGTVERRGVADPITPAIRGWLIHRGVPERIAATLALRGGTRKGYERHGIGESGFSITMPAGWTLRPRQGVHEVHAIEPPPTIKCEIVLRTWSIGSSARLGRSPTVKLLEDLLPGNARPLIEAGFQSKGRAPIAARGVTGVIERFEKGRIGEIPSWVGLALFARRDDVLLIRTHLAGPADHEFVTDMRGRFEELYRGVDPLRGHAAIYDGERTRILIRTPDGTRFIDRGGRRHESPTALPLFGLRGEPLCRHIAWRTDQWTIAGPTSVRKVADDCLLLAPDGSSLSGDAASFRFGRSGRLARSTIEGHVLDPRSENGWQVVQWFDGFDDDAGREVAEHGAPLRPARWVDAVDDPGSKLHLCAIASDHFPVSGRAGQPESVGRLTYVPRLEGPQRDLLVRVRPGADQPVIHSPRFLPSGMEILFIDPERGLCVIPRDGGLPVILLPGEVLEAEPWLQPKS